MKNGISYSFLSDLKRFKGVGFSIHKEAVRINCLIFDYEVRSLLNPSDGQTEHIDE